MSKSLPKGTGFGIGVLFYAIFGRRWWLAVLVLIALVYLISIAP
jgi:hypothetical protein